MTITQQRLKELLHYDPTTGLFTWAIRRRKVRVGQVAGTIVDKRIEIRIDYHRYKAHRLAWLYVYGIWPFDQIDHKDRNSLNNSISNLRDVSHKQNMENTGIRTNNTSGIKGVSWSNKDKRWRAAIQHHNKTHYLGNFIDKAQASAAYIKARTALFTSTSL